MTSRNVDCEAVRAVTLGVLVTAALSGYAFAQAPDTTPPTVVEVRACDGAGGDVVLPGTLDFAPAEIRVTFDEPVDPATVSADTVRLVRSGGDGTFGDGNEVEITPVSVTPTAGDIVTMGFGGVTVPDDTYQVAVAGTSLPDAGLVGYWAFDETSGTTAYDSSGNGNDGTLVEGLVWRGAGLVWTADGKLGGALHMGGGENHVMVASHASLEPASAISLAMWVCAMDALPDVWSDLIRKSGSPTEGYHLRWSHKDGILQFRTGRSSEISFSVTDTQFNSSYLGAWHHFAATYDAASGVARLFVDGAERTSLSGLQGPLEHGDDLYIMGQPYSGHAGLPGRVDEVRIYDRALSAGEIQTLAKGTLGVRDLAGNVLDGEYGGSLPSGEGTAGGDFALAFIVTGDAPTVSFTSPADAGAAVSVFSAIEITFSEPMDRTSAENAFSCDGGVTGSFSWSGETLVFLPSTQLGDNTTYTVTVGGSATDWDSMQMLSDYGFPFTTANALSGGQPLPSGYMSRMLHLGTTETDRITGLSVGTDYFFQAGLGPEYKQQPSPGVAVDLSPASTTETPMIWTELTDGDGDGIWAENVADEYVMYWAIYVMAPSTRQARLYVLHDDDSTCWMDGASTPVCSLPMWGGGCSSIFTLAAGRTHGFVFKLRETWGSDCLAVRFEDPAGGPMSDLRHMLTDQVPPSVEQTSPGDGEVDVPPSAGISLTFTEAIDTSVDASAVATITGGSSAGSWQWSDASGLAWSPSSSLQPLTTYSVTISTDVVDMSGIPLVEPYTFAFTTAAEGGGGKDGPCGAGAGPAFSVLALAGLLALARRPGRRMQAGEPS